MRTYLVCVMTVLFQLSCLTVDPPRPIKLKAPISLNAEIVNFDSTFNEPGEFIKISWEKNPQDTISTANYTIIIKTDSTGTSSKITNIPNNIKNSYSSINTLYSEESRSVQRPIIYSIFSIDTLGRVGDTSQSCTVIVAPSVLLSSPGKSVNILDSSIVFKWFVRKVPDQTISSVSLWNEDTILWSSLPESLYTGGEDFTPVTENFPEHLLPLDIGLYTWIVSLQIVNGLDEPTSFTFKDLNVIE